ncbi:hypothetical protein HK097_001832 [Rhizophlyctis rosea]|uniref:SHSP domain-containing protein n=1 Tax=Rhizophlyctis rosea TaxID=64517 RepID=A0AAD5SGX6_9FUNG|nr:hypothetical protein HK097_001832 [Rhizophlyctis rosea]
MGLFGFFFKLGAVAVAYDYFVTKRREGHDLPWWERAHNGYIHPSNTTAMTKHNPREDPFNTDDLPTCFHRISERWKARRAEWQSRMALYHPPTEIREMPNGKYTLEIEVPGLKKEDLVVSVVDEDKGIVLKGASVGEKDVNGNLRRREVDARVLLPRNADLGNMKAKLEDGVLKLTTEKKEFEGRRLVVE